MSEKKNNKDKLKKNIAGFPHSPGVYLMKTKDDVVLYVGKAKDIKKRTASYLRDASVLDDKTEAMLNTVHKIEYIQTSSEIEALLTEARLIKDIKPKYNIALKDDKTYPMLAIDKNEDFPRVLITRDRDKTKYYLFGPYTSANELRMVYKLLQQIFKFRICNLAIVENDAKRHFFRPCLLFSIQLCSAPCAAKITKVQYQKLLSMLKSFILGKISAIEKELKKMMERCSAGLKFEEAGRYRDMLKAIEGVKERAVVKTPQVNYNAITPGDPNQALNDLAKIFDLQFPPRIINGIDVAVLSGKSAAGSLVTFIDGAPFKPEYRKYKIRTTKTTDDYSMIAEIIRRRFERLANDEILMPDVLLIDGGMGHLNTGIAVLDELGVRPQVVAALSKTVDCPHEQGELFFLYKGTVKKVLRPSSGFKLLQFVRDEAHRFAQYYHKTLRAKSMFE